MSSSGLRLSLLPSVILKAMSWSLWVMSRWSLKPKNQSMVLRPLLASHLKTLLMWIRALRQTASVVLSAKEGLIQGLTYVSTQI